jgi:hypothetical protein
MKPYASNAILITVFAVAPSGWAQTCVYSSVTSFQGDYSLTGSGSGPDKQKIYTWTVSHEFSATANLSGFPYICGGRSNGAVTP